MVPYNQMKPHQLPPFIKLRHPDGKEDIHYSVFYDDIPNEFKNIIQTELNETEEKRKKGMQRLREVLKKEGKTGVDDLVLLSCLRKCKYNIKKSESQVLNYIKTLEMMCEILQQTDMDKLEQVLDHMAVGLLPYRDKKGRAIFFTTPNINFELFDLEDSSLVFCVILAFLLSIPLTSITGLVYIAESKTPSIELLYSITKLFRQKWHHITSFPARIGRIEILNEIFIVRWTVNFLKHFSPAKFGEKVNFYGSDVINMRKSYHPDLLPEEFGGTMGPLSNTLYKEKLLNFMKNLKKKGMT